MIEMGHRLPTSSANINPRLCFKENSGCTEAVGEWQVSIRRDFHKMKDPETKRVGAPLERYKQAYAQKDCNNDSEVLRDMHSAIGKFTGIRVLQLLDILKPIVASSEVLMSELAKFKAAQDEIKLKNLSGQERGDAYSNSFIEQILLTYENI
jgi:hypothetical protein